jgi:UDP-N-acetylmuramyl pentapeptide synthase
VFNPLIDFIEQRGKDAAKALYRQPVITAAGLWRRALTAPCFIGVTGSAGKTTTKDLLFHALAHGHRSVRSADSNNQLYNVARTVLGTPFRAEFCVQELGASEVGGFNPMLALLQPKVAVVTNIGLDHRKSFRNRESVAQEKSKLVACVPADGMAVLNADDELVAAMADRCRGRVVTYGLQKAADFRAEVITSAWPDRLTLRIQHGEQHLRVPTRLLGTHQAGSVLAAVAAACSLGITLQEAAESVGRVEPMLMRMSVHPTARGVTFIRDDWKAPNWSLPNALQFMATAQAARKIIVLGTISDYAGGAGVVYRRAVALALDSADYVVTIGRHAESLQKHFQASVGDRLQGFQSVQAASRWLEGFARAQDLVLLKGSIGGDHLARLALAMDQAVGCWRARCGRYIPCDRCRLIGQAAPL